MKYLITISYDGSKFLGFQRLNKGSSVQKELENALSKINKSAVEVKGAGRTDRGVHASGQKVSFDLDIDIPRERLKNAINSLLSDYVYVKDCKVVDANFHARFNVKKKKYVYKINLGEYNPIIAGYAFWCPYKLDISKMKKCSKLFLGVHDFHNFVSGERDNYTAIIYDISFKKKKDILEISFIGKIFYRYMVRNLVGAMIEVGRGKETLDKVKEMLKGAENMSLFTAPACGLYLEDIEY